ncbi:MAG: PEP-CTERM sorting domain-containing protein, partial [bacterium]
RTPARAARTAILAAATLLLASTAGAVPTFTLLSPSSLTVALGEEFTIQIALDNPGGTSVVGVDGQLTGLLASGATVVSGRTARVHFTGFCTASNCFGGLPICASCFFDSEDLSENAAFQQGVSDNLQIINALSFTGTTQTGAADPGLIGAINEPSALDVTVTLSLANLGEHVLMIGGEWLAGAGVPIEQISGTTLTVTVVPEPGTALLMGLGLTGLSFAGRRR